MKRIERELPTSDVTGVSFCNRNKKWRARVKTGPITRKSLGYFQKKEDAEDAVRRATATMTTESNIQSCDPHEYEPPFEPQPPQAQPDVCYTEDELVALRAAFDATTLLLRKLPLEYHMSGNYDEKNYGHMWENVNDDDDDDYQEEGCMYPMESSSTSSDNYKFPNLSVALDGNK